jgi:hypothetical protein
MDSITRYYLTRQHHNQRYTLSTRRLSTGENIGPFADYEEAKEAQKGINATYPPRPRRAKPDTPAPQPKTLLTRQEFGEAVYQMVKAEIESRGFSLWVENFDPDYPCSLRTLWNIRKGIFDIETVRKLPGIRVEEWFTVETV